MEKVRHILSRFLARRVRRYDPESGMTLIEIMIVVAIIGLIMGGVGVVAFTQWKKAQIKEARTEVHEVMTALQLWATQEPTPCPPSLAELVNQKVLSKAAKDPWGEDLIFRCPGEQNPDGADVISKGPDRREGTQDDIKSWEL